MPTLVGGISLLIIILLVVAIDNGIEVLRVTIPELESQQLVFHFQFLFGFDLLVERMTQFLLLVIQLAFRLHLGVEDRGNVLQALEGRE